MLPLTTDDVEDTFRETRLLQRATERRNAITQRTDFSPPTVRKEEVLSHCV